MHIHVPKPIHGWKQFFNEVAVITLGIAIALGGEQLLEKWNEHHQADLSLAAIKDEIGSNTGGLKSRMATEPCIQRRLDAVARYIEVAQGPRPNWVGRPQIWMMNSSAAEAARSYGSLTALPRDDQMAISDIYGGFTAINDYQRDEQLAWAELRSITEDRELTDSDKASLRQAIQRARLADWGVRINAAQAIAKARDALGATPDPDIVGSKSVCVAMTTPFDEAVKLSGSTYGEPR
ncbi:MAG: hypothetical protein ABIO29_03790 [Sphingomicrobium sp.]